jgi:hypothetical protein
MSKAIVEDLEAFYKWLNQQPLCRAYAAQVAGMSPHLSQLGNVSEKKVISEEDMAFAEALKGMV